MTSWLNKSFWENFEYLTVFFYKAQQGTKGSKKKNTKREAAEENATDYIDPHTPSGEKKQLSSQMAKQYNPVAVENSWVSTVSFLASYVSYRDHVCL